MHIRPSTIRAGFGSLTRSELSDLLAVFEDPKLFNVVIGRIKDLGDRVGPVERSGGDPAFQQRLAETADEVFRSDHSDAVLRLQLWHRTREAFGLEAAIPLATRTANLRAADAAQRAADELLDSTAKGQEQRSWTIFPAAPGPTPCSTTPSRSPRGSRNWSSTRWSGSSPTGRGISSA